VGDEGVGEPPTLPVQTVPLRAKLAGTGLLPTHDPLNPKLVLPALAMAAFHAALVTVTWAPDCVYDPFHNWVTVCPAVKLQLSRQPLIPSPRLVTVTLAPKPPGHWFVIA